MTVDAIVLAGGRGRRLAGRPPGVTKAEVLVAGRTLLDRALDATAGALRVVVVGPAHLARPGVVTVLEDPPDGGPVAGLAAGLAALGGPGDAGRPVLVLACDVPRAAEAVPALLAALAADPGADGAHLVRDGRAQLVAVHRPGPLRAALAGLAAEDGGVRGASVRRLLGRLRMAEVPDDDHRSADADTWDDVARLESVLARRDTMTAQTPDDLDRWSAAVAEALDVDPTALDRDLVLDLTRDVAHTVARPAVPLTTFLMGMAVGARGGDRAALDSVAAQVGELNRRWADDAAAGAVGRPTS